MLRFLINLENLINYISLFHDFGNEMLMIVEMKDKYNFYTQFRKKIYSFFWFQWLLRYLASLLFEN